MIGRIEAELQLHAAVVTDAARCETVAETLARRGEAALAFHRSDQRAQIALEPEPVERSLRTADAVGEVHAAILDRDLVGLQPIEIKADARRRPVEAPIAGKTE